MRLADLVTPQVVEVDGEKQSVWLNGSRAGETFVVNPGVKRIIEFGWAKFKILYIQFADVFLDDIQIVI